MCGLLLRNFVLWIDLLVLSQCKKRHCTTYCLVPSPIAGHQISVLALPLAIYLLWREVHHVIVLWV